MRYNARMPWYIIAFLAASVFFGIVILVAIIGLIRKSEAEKREHDETTSLH